MFIIPFSSMTHDCTYDDSENDVMSILAFYHKGNAQLTKNGSLMLLLLLFSYV